MPKKKTLQRARKDARAGKSPSTQAGEFVREEIEDVRHGKHGVRSPQQAIAIGLSKARRAGVKLRPYKGHQEKPAQPGHHPSPRRSAATLRALKREPHSTVSHAALSEQTHEAAKRRGSAQRHAAAMKAVRTKGHAALARAARKAVHTRSQQAHGGSR